MLLAFDIGNTTMAIGLFRGPKLVKGWKIKTDRDKTADEYGAVLLNLFQVAAQQPKKIEAAIISSVVPPLTPVIEDVCRSTFGRTASVVGPGLKTGMPILYENPLEVGADRITASVAAFEKYGGPTIVLDFGTATTFDAISAKGDYDVTHRLVLSDSYALPIGKGKRYLSGVNPVVDKLVGGWEISGLRRSPPASLPTSRCRATG